MGKMKSKITSFFLYTSLFVGGMFLGDKYQPVQALEERTKFYHRVAEENTPLDYNNWAVEKIVNDSGMVELYLSNLKTDSSYKISRNLQVNCPVCPEIKEKKLGEHIDNYFDKQFEHLDKKTQVMQDNLKVFSKEILSDLKEVGYKLKDFCE